MKDLSSWMRAGDPAADDGAMSEAHAEVMRRRVLDAARQFRPPLLAWQAPAAVAATVVLTLAAGVLAGHWTSRSERSMQPAAAASAVIESPRQLQFSTPGGTRIIWVFDADFDLKESTP